MQKNKFKDSSNRIRNLERVSIESKTAKTALDRLDDAEKLEPARTREPEVREIRVEVPTPERVPLADIKPREVDIRPVSERRARQFAINIAVVGLIQPITIDANGIILAGEHRRRALQILQELSDWPERIPELLPDVSDDHRAAEECLKAWRKFGYDQGVPVHRMDVDSKVDLGRARAIEISENTIREPFSKEEARGGYEQLTAAGYTHVVGRPKKGEKPIGPQLAILFGKSMRTVGKYIAEFRAEHEPPAPPANPPLSEAEALIQERFPNAKVRTSKSGAGRFTVEFTNLDDLRTILG
jgi:ParB family chromosome partitioning protein